MIWGAGTAQMVWTLQDLTARMKSPAWLQKVLPAAVIAALVIGYIPAMLLPDLDLIHNYQQKYVNQVVWEYTDASLPVRA